MQNFYKVTQNNSEKVPSFATRLEGTLNQIQLQCPRRIISFMWCKNIWDSIHYLYSNPNTTYSQLMVTAHKVESEDEEAWDKVCARPAMTTKPVKGASKLGNQIARLMAALIRAGQGSSPGSTPNSPRHRGCGRGRLDRTTSSFPYSEFHNGQTGLGQTTSAHSISAGHGTATTGQGNAQGQRWTG